MKKKSATLLLIRGENIKDIPVELKLDELISLLKENGFECGEVLGKENMLRFVHPDSRNEGDTLTVFNEDGKLSFCKYSTANTAGVPISFSERFLKTNTV